jgi:hypothetical protein
MSPTTAAAHHRPQKGAPIMATAKTGKRATTQTLPPKPKR